MGKTWDQKTDETIKSLHPKVRVKAFQFINDADKKLVEDEIKIEEKE